MKKLELITQEQRCKEWTNGRYSDYCREFNTLNCPMVCNYAKKNITKEELYKMEMKE
jgi:hypothetical protein